MGAESRLASVTKCDAIILTPEISAVVTTCKDGLNRSLLLDFCEKSGIDCLTAGVIAFLAVDWL